MINQTSLDLFEILCKNNYDRVYRAVYLYTKNQQITEDAVQQAFVIAFRKLDQLKDKDKFHSWVITIALNEAKRVLINQSKHKIIPLTEIEFSLASDDSQFYLKDEVQTSLKQLKTNESEILYLKYYADLSLEQISKFLDISLSNAKVRLHRAKVSFRILLSKDNEDFGGGSNGNI